MIKSNISEKNYITDKEKGDTYKENTIMENIQNQKIIIKTPIDYSKEEVQIIKRLINSTIGIYNVENNICFINSVIQILLH